MKVHLKASNGQYICAQNGGGGLLAANRSRADVWETFDLESVNGSPISEGSRIGIRTYNGQYVCAESSGDVPLVANRSTLGPWETFVVSEANHAAIADGGKITLKAVNGKYVCAEGGGGRELTANRDAFGPWETFTLETTVGVWFYSRDTITIGPDFANEVQAEIAAKKIPAYSTLYFAARECKHASGFSFRLSDYNVVIMAEEYDGNAGAIDLSGNSGAAGATGADGTAGFVSEAEDGQLNKPGGPGANGSTGASGTNAANLTLYCKRLRNATFQCSGGAGGQGGNGGKGGEGGTATRVVIDPDGSKHLERIGTDGGNGGNGGTGGTGGSGGQISVFYVEGAPPVVNVNGGSAGIAGPGGGGGEGGAPDCNAGESGNAGSPGAVGPNGISSIKQVTEKALFGMLQGAGVPGMQSVANAWGQYRRRMGEFYFRSFTPSRPQTRNYLSMAANEFRSALLLLTPGETEATRVLLEMVNAGMMPAGLPRDHYVIPDFTRYEQAFVQYAPLVQALISDAKDILLNANNIEQNRRTLTARIQNIREQVEIIENEKNEAVLEHNRVVAARDANDERIRGADAEIAAKQKELSEARIEAADNFFISVAEAIVAVVAVIGAVYTGGASLAALGPLLVAAQKSWSSLSVDESGNVTYGGAYIVDWIQWTDKDGKFSPKPKPEIEKLGGGLKDVIKAGQSIANATLDLIDKIKVLGDIDNAKVNGQLEHEYKQLLKRRAELAFERAQSNMLIEESKLRLKTIDLRAAQAQADLAAANSLLLSLTSDNVLLGRVANMLVRRAQDYVTYLIRFHFLAARALEIYSLQDYTSSVAYDIGFIHPDVEENAYLALSRGQGSSALSLMEAYLASWSALPKIVSLRSAFLTYSERLVSQTQSWTFEPPKGRTPGAPDDSVYTNLRLRKSAEFEISLADLYNSRFECKIDRVAIALVGATAKDFAINCVLTHKGQSSAKRLDGTVLTFSYPPMALPVAAAKTDSPTDETPAGQSEAFWGRSPAAKWRLLIEPAVISGSQVDLNSMIKIVLTITYKTFLTASLQTDKDKGTAATRAPA